MEMITLLFYALGSFFGIENSTMLAMETTVTIDPVEKTIHLQQKNIVGLLLQESDSLSLKNQLVIMHNKEIPWSEATKEYSKSIIKFSEGINNTLDAEIELNYASEKDLRAYGFSTSPMGKISLINIPDWNLETTDGTLNGAYWNFEPSEAFTFTITAQEIPEPYKSKLVSLFPYWQQEKQ